jgi:hypothetical protein
MGRSMSTVVAHEERQLGPSLRFYCCTTCNSAIHPPPCACDILQETAACLGTGARLLFTLFTSYTKKHNKNAQAQFSVEYLLAASPSECFFSTVRGYLLALKYCLTSLGSLASTSLPNVM